jgi:multiple sugar transport system ATP-binding protein
MARVTFKNVLIGRGDSIAGEGFTLEVADREFVVLTGPPGCGISAVLRMVAGLEPAQGEILLDGRPLNDLCPKDREIAVVSGDYQPYPLLTVRANLTMGLERRGFPTAEIEKRVLAVAEIMGLEGILERSAHLASEEERQRIALSRAMVLQPKGYLFDEPGGTRAGRRRTRADITNLYRRSPATMIYATHDPMEAMAIGDRMVVIDRGVVQQDGSARSIYEEPANLFVAGFMGEQPMNLVEGTLKQDRDSLLFVEAGEGTIQVRLPSSRYSNGDRLAGKTVVLGIRPEHLEIASARTGGPAAGFRALVERVEAKGLDTDLYLQTGAHTLICRTRQEIDQREGGYRAEIGIDLAKTKFFERDSGGRIMQEA